MCVCVFECGCGYAQHREEGAGEPGVGVTSACEWTTVRAELQSSARACACTHSAVSLTRITFFSLHLIEVLHILALLCTCPMASPSRWHFPLPWVLGQPTDWPTLPASHLLCTYSCIISRTLFKDCIEFVKKQGNLSPWIEILLLRQLALSWDHSLQAWRLTGSWPHSEPSLATGSLCPCLEHYQTGKGSFFVKGLLLLSLSTSFSSVSCQAFWGWVM